MKKFLVILVVLGLCGVYWYGCQKKAPEAVVVEEEVTTETVAPATTPPPAPEAEAEKPAEGEKTE